MTKVVFDNGLSSLNKKIEIGMKDLLLVKIDNISDRIQDKQVLVVSGLYYKELGKSSTYIANLRLSLAWDGGKHIYGVCRNSDYIYNNKSSSPSLFKM